MNRWLALGLLLAASVALALRIPQLPQRPLHNDEAVNAVKFGQLWTEGSYKYDPDEHHGPSLPYATSFLARLTGAPGINDFSEYRLRIVTVLFGAGLILLLPLVVDGLGRQPMLWAALFTTVSPAMVFYSRYYIHEMLLVFFGFLAIGAGWRYWRSRKPGWALLAGAAIGLMDATKETFIISVVTALLALLCNQIWNRWIDASSAPRRTPRLNWLHLLAGLAAWIAVGILFFSSFLTNASGPLDSLRTYIPWLNRAGGNSPHIHPWSFYLHRLLFYHIDKGPIWTEALIYILALVGAASGFIRQRLGGSNASFIRFLAFYSFGLLAAYSLISYKTPWCLLNFWQPMILLAGVGATVLGRTIRQQHLRFAYHLLILAATAQLGWQAWRASIPMATDTRNPHVYAHTSPSVLELVERVKKIADASPQGRDTVIKVMAEDADYWPLPWYLRSFEHVGYWDQILPDPFAPIMIISASFHAGLDEKKTHLMNGYFQLRPQNFLELYVGLDTWMEYLKKHPPKRDEE